MSPALARLQKRAEALATARHFFAERSVLEVDTSLLSPYAAVDEHIELMEVSAQGESRYLLSSPEYAMKRLLAEGSGDIYQLSHVYRAGEQGTYHHPVFTMAEWYRIGFSFEEMIDETVAFIQTFLGAAPRQTWSYQQLFQRYCQIDPLTASEEELYEAVKQGPVPPYPSLQNEGRDAMLNHLLATKIEPHFPEKTVTVLHSFPPSQAALAKVENGTARRFEVYYGTTELANGYHELTDALEQEARFTTTTKKRAAQGKASLPIDPLFLDALQRGMPDCCGVAVGFDRLLMLQQSSKSIQEVLALT